MEINRDRHNLFIARPYYSGEQVITTESTDSTSSGTTIIIGGGGGSGLTDELYLKLAGIEEGAQVNLDAFSYIQLSNGTDVAEVPAISATDTATLEFKGVGVDIEVESLDKIDLTEVTSTGINTGTYSFAYGKHVTTIPPTTEDGEPTVEILWLLEINYVSGDRLEASAFNRVHLLDKDSVVGVWQPGDSWGSLTTNASALLESIVLEWKDVYFRRVQFVNRVTVEGLTEDTVVCDFNIALNRTPTVVIKSATDFWKLDENGNLYTTYNTYSTKEISAYGLGPGGEVTGALYLSELKDVDTTNLRDAGLLLYNATTNKWVVTDGSSIRPDLTGYATQEWVVTTVDSKIATLVNSAPEALDTLKELAAALGNDPNFSTTVLTLIGTNTKDITDLKTLVLAFQDMFEWDKSASATDSSKWIIKAKASLYSIAEVSAYGYQEGDAPTGALYLYELKDVTLNSLTSGQLLQWNGTKWINIDKDAVGLNESELATYLTSNNYAKLDYVTWSNLTGKPAWIGTTKPSYSYSEITGTPTVTWDNVTGRPTWIDVNAKPTYTFAEITSKPTSLAGYGIIDGINALVKSGTGNGIKELTIAGHTLTYTMGSFIESSTFDDLFEKVNIGTTEDPVYAIKAKYNFYSVGEIAAYGWLESHSPSGAQYLYELRDVTLTSLSNGLLLQWNGTTWVNIDKDAVGLNESELAAYLTANSYAKTSDITWSAVSNKPTWIGSSKPTYSYSEISGTPTSLKNPYALTIQRHGTAVGSYDGSEAKTLNIAAPSWTEVTSKPTTVSGYGITDTYTKTLVDTLLSSKANTATTLAGYGITNAYNKTQTDNLLAAKADKATTLAGYGITDGVNAVSKSGTGNALTSLSVSGHTLTYTMGSTFLTLSIFDDLFEKVNVGTTASPVYAIKAKYHFYSVGEVTAWAQDSMSLPSIWNSLPIDPDTLGWVDGLLTVVGGVGNAGSIKVNGTTYYPDDGGLITLPSYPTTLPASDVYAWAKASTKPSYAWSEITSKPSWIGSSKPTYAYSEISGTPTALKNPYAITFTGYQSKTYDGSAAVSVAIPTTLPASDVYAWAKASAKPTYTFAEITSKPTSLAGYGITDAYTKNETEARYVTLSTAQTISNTKIFTASLRFNVQSLHFQNATTGGSANGLYLYKNGWGAIKAGIGFFTAADGDPTMYIGWGTTPYVLASSLAIASSNIWYKGNALLHAGNWWGFTDSRYVNVVGDIMQGSLGFTNASNVYFLNDLSRSVGSNATLGTYLRCGSNYLYVTSSDVLMGTNRIWHEGNDGYNSTLVASDSGHLYVWDVRSDERAPTYYWEKSVTAIFNNATNPFGDWYSGINVAGWETAAYASWQLISYSAASTYAGRGLYFRTGKGSTWDSWRELAFTTSNVASATKLQTARTLWGQSFNGTANITGDMSNVGNVLSPANNSKLIGSASNQWASVYTGMLTSASNTRLAIGIGGTGHVYLTTEGNLGIGTSTPGYKLHVTGHIRAEGYISAGEYADNSYGYVNVCRPTDYNYTYFSMIRSGMYVTGIGMTTGNEIWLGYPSSNRRAYAYWLRVNSTTTTFGNNTYVQILSTDSNPYLKLTCGGREWFILGYGAYLYLGGRAAYALRINNTGDTYTLGSIEGEYIYARSGLRTSSPNNTENVVSQILYTDGDSYVRKMSLQRLKTAVYISRRSLDLRSYNSNTWYPCWISGRGQGYRKLSIVNTLLGDKPTWATHNSGFTLVVEMSLIASEWGVKYPKANLDSYMASFGGETAFGGYELNDMVGDFIIWLRGGAVYYYTTDIESTLQSSTSGYSWTSGSYSYTATPRTTLGNYYSGFNVNIFYSYREEDVIRLHGTNYSALIFSQPLNYTGYYFGAEGGDFKISLVISGGRTILSRLNTDGIFLDHGWYRTYSTTGWYNQSYGGGVYMTDTTWVRAYNKPFRIDNAFGIGCAGFGVGLKLYGSNNTSIEVSGGSYTMGLGCHSNGNWYWWRGTASPDSSGSKSYVMTYSGSMWSFTGSLVATGEVTAYSDRRLKSNIADLNFRGKLRPRTYIKDDKQQIGFVALEVLELYPELVLLSDDENKYLSLNYGNITAVLSAQINVIDDEVSLLKKRVKELEDKLKEYDNNN